MNSKYVVCTCHCPYVVWIYTRRNAKNYSIVKKSYYVIVEKIEYFGPKNKSPFCKILKIIVTGILIKNFDLQKWLLLICVKMHDSSDSWEPGKNPSWCHSSGVWAGTWHYFMHYFFSSKTQYPCISYQQQYFSLLEVLRFDKAT